MADEPEQARHAKAVASLFAEHNWRMVGYARNRLTSWGIPVSWVDAEDLVQTAYMNVLARPRPIRSLRPYVYRVIDREISQSAKRYRASHRYEAAAQGALLVLDPNAQHPDLSDTVAEHTDLSAALRVLPPQQRRAVLYNKVMGLTQAETAQAMGKDAGTIATHVSRAVSALKISLGAASIILVCITAAWLRAVKQMANPAAGGEAAEAAARLLGTWVLALAVAMLLLASVWGVVNHPLWWPSIPNPKLFVSRLGNRLLALTARRQRRGPVTQHLARERQQHAAPVSFDLGDLFGEDREPWRPRVGLDKGDVVPPLNPSQILLDADSPAGSQPRWHRLSDQTPLWKNDPRHRRRVGDVHAS